jgi:hypothetical protein
MSNSVLHLDGRRTGRRPGSRSTPAWEKAARWAARNLDKDDAVPPNEFARCLRDQAKEQPISFLTAMALLDGRRPAQPPEHGGTGVPKGGMRMRRLSVPVSGLASWAQGLPEPAWLSRLPDGCELLGVVLDRTRRRVVLTVCHDSFPAVPDGQPVPVERFD